MRFYTNCVQRGDNLLLRGYEMGRGFNRKVKFEPTLYLPNPKGSWKTIHGKALEPMTFGSINEAKDFLKMYEGIDNFEIYGLPRFDYTYLNEEFPGEVQYDREHIQIANIDIEVSSANGFPSVDRASDEITAITVRKHNIYHVFGYGEYNTSREDVRYTKCRNERDLLDKFLDRWMYGGYPDVVTGWNIAFFDIPYIVKRMNFILGEGAAKKLSPWGFFQERTSNQKFGKESTSLSIGGISSLDYLELYKKFTYNQQESYRLDAIAEIELGEKKLDYSEYDSLNDLYVKNHQKYISYNIHDVELIDKLDDKMKLIDLALTLAYDAKVNYNDVFTQVRMWDVMTHNHLYDKKIAVPSNVDGFKDEAYEGAYVKDPQIGAHDWVMSFDLTSLYPSLIMNYNISPETITDEHTQISINQLLDHNEIMPIAEGYSLAPNGYYFSNKEQGFIPQMIEKIFIDRVQYKDKMLEAQKAYEATNDNKKKRELSKQISRYKNLQLAKKVNLNSCYGALGNKYFRFFDLRQATAITIGGQLAIRWAENAINRYMNKMLGTTDKDFVIASDTDSLYIKFDDIVKHSFGDKKVSKDRVIAFLDEVSKKKIEPFLEETYTALASRMNAFSNRMHMKRENIADRGIWTAKKRYILNVYNSEGVQYKEPKLKIMGLEAIKSSTPSSCRVAIKKAMTIIMNGDEPMLQSYIAEFRETFKKLPFEDIAFPRGVQGLKKQRGKSEGIPIHVRGALAYNKNLNNMKLTKKYEEIKEGEKIRFCYLRMPNHIHENVLSVPHTLPKEFALDSYIDYNVQFDKAFLQPLKSILNVIDWKDEKRNTIEDFFS